MSPYEPDLPEDFDEFWREAAQEAQQAPLDFHRDIGNAFDLPGFQVETFEFRGIDGGQLNGWIAFPPGARRLPGFLWIPPYGRESLLPNEYGTRQGFTSLSFNFFGHEAFHQEVYRKERGYFSEGAGDPHTFVFRRMFQNAYIAVRVLQAQIEADEDHLASMGMSQGAGISIWLGAWCPLVKAVCADMPFLGAMKAVFERPIYRYPTKELIDFAETIPVGLERVKHTLSYYDTMHQATRCKAPTQVSLGLKDPAVKVENAEAVYEAVAGEKRLLRYDIGHDWHPDMVPNNRRWLEEHL